MPPPPSLLVVDLQQGLVSPPPEEGPRSTPSLAANVSAILARWRELHYPLIHIHHRASDHRDTLHESHPETNAAHACSAPLPGEVVRLKKTTSAFATNDHDAKSLAEAIAELIPDAGAGTEKVKLVVIGMDGAQCVNSTVRSAADLGIDVTVVADASASFGTQGWKGAAGETAAAAGWGPEETHDMAMSILAGAYAKVVTTEELLGGLK